MQSRPQVVRSTLRPHCLFETKTRYVKTKTSLITRPVMNKNQDHNFENNKIQDNFMCTVNGY